MLLLSKKHDLEKFQSRYFKSYWICASVSTSIILKDSFSHNYLICSNIYKLWDVIFMHHLCTHLQLESLGSVVFRCKLLVNWLRQSSVPRSPVCLSLMLLTWGAKWSGRFIDMHVCTLEKIITQTAHQLPRNMTVKIIPISRILTFTPTSSGYFRGFHPIYFLNNHITFKTENLNSIFSTPSPFCNLGISKKKKGKNSHT